MKSILFVICILSLFHTAFGQQIKSRNAELDDFLTLLRASGYELFSFDITDMLKDRYDIVITVKEYEKGEETESKLFDYSCSNKKLLTDYKESEQLELIKEGRVIDSETSAIAYAKKINIGFYPSGNDSTGRVQFNVPGFMAGSLPLKLRGLTMKDSDKKFYSYNTRPFKLGQCKEDTFFPLVLFGSMWYDEQYKVFRFCGESEIDSGMSSKILKDIPHYYVFGVIFRKKQ